MLPKGVHSFEKRLVEATEKQSSAVEREVIATALLASNTAIIDILAGIRDAMEELVAFFQPSTPRFVSVIWLSTGNLLIGTKSDGTIWKAPAGGDPLVWTNISE